MKITFIKLGIIFTCISLLMLTSSCSYKIIKHPIPDKLLVLSFDDAPASQYSIVAPMLKQYGFGATFFVCEFPPNYADSSKYMNWRQIQQLYKMGFEIGNHTQTHAHVNKLSKTALVHQLSYIENKCDSLHIPKPKTFAYPGYDVNQQCLNILEAKGYVFARAGGSRVYDPKKDHPFLIPSWATNSDNETEIMEALEQAKNGKIVVLTIHGVPDAEHPWVNTPPEMLKKYFDYLAKNHFKVIAVKDLEKYIRVKRAKKNITPDFSKQLKN